MNFNMTSNRLKKKENHAYIYSNHMPALRSYKYS